MTKRKTPAPTTDAVSSSSSFVENVPKPKGLGRRHFTACMLFIGMAFAYVMRTNMSVAIVAMTEDTLILRNRRQVWTEVERGTLLSSFFYGYVITQMPIGFLTIRYDALKMMGWGMLLNGVFSLLIPLSSYSYWCLFAVRLIQGLGEGPIVPCTHTILAKWIPPAERSFLVGFVYSGAQFGTIISYPMSGYISYNESLGGWPSIFYLSGVLCLIWSILFLKLAKENPSIDKRISEEEKKYIVNPIFGGDIIEDLKGTKIPWNDILHSKPFLAILVAHMGQNFGYETLMTMLPTFLKEMFQFNLKENGLISATPYIAMFLSSCVLNYLANWLIFKKKLSTVATRKLMTSIGEIGPGILFIILSLLDYSTTASIACLILAMACNGAIYAGFKVNHIDISPCFAGILISITNCSANVVGMLAPTLSGVLLGWFGRGTELAWNTVFLVSAFMYILCATLYLIFASGKKQPWDKKVSKAIFQSRMDDDNQ